MIEVFLRECMDLRRRIGGPVGLAAVLLAAAGGMAIGVRLGTQVVDPAYLFGFTGVALAFAGNFTARSFGEESQLGRLVNRAEYDPPDVHQVTGRTLAAALYGLLCWAITLGSALYIADKANSAAAMPVSRVLSFTLLTFTAAWAFSAGVAGITVSAGSIRLGWSFARGVLALLLLAVIIGWRLAPAGVRRALSQSLTSSGSLVPILSVVCMALVYLLSRVAIRTLASKRENLSILG